MAGVMRAFAATAVAVLLCAPVGGAVAPIVLNIGGKPLDVHESMLPQVGLTDDVVEALFLEMQAGEKARFPVPLDALDATRSLTEFGAKQGIPVQQAFLQLKVSIPEVEIHRLDAELVLERRERGLTLELRTRLARPARKATRVLAALLGHDAGSPEYARLHTEQWEAVVPEARHTELADAMKAVREARATMRPALEAAVRVRVYDQRTPLLHGTSTKVTVSVLDELPLFRLSFDLDASLNKLTTHADWKLLSKPNADGYAPLKVSRRDTSSEQTLVNLADMAGVVNTIVDGVLSSIGGQIKGLGGALGRSGCLVSELLRPLPPGRERGKPVTVSIGLDHDVKDIMASAGSSAEAGAVGERQRPGADLDVLLQNVLDGQLAETLAGTGMVVDVGFGGADSKQLILEIEGERDGAQGGLLEQLMRLQSTVDISLVARTELVDRLAPLGVGVRPCFNSLTKTGQAFATDPMTLWHTGTGPLEFDPWSAMLPFGAEGDAEAMADAETAGTIKAWRESALRARSVRACAAVEVEIVEAVAQAEKAVPEGEKFVQACEELAVRVMGDAMLEPADHKKMDVPVKMPEALGFDDKLPLKFPKAGVKILSEGSPLVLSVRAEYTPPPGDVSQANALVLFRSGVCGDMREGMASGHDMGMLTCKFSDSLTWVKAPYNEDVTRGGYERTLSLPPSKPLELGVSYSVHYCRTNWNIFSDVVECYAHADFRVAHDGAAAEKALRQWRGACEAEGKKKASGVVDVTGEAALRVKDMYMKAHAVCSVSQLEEACAVLNPYKSWQPPQEEAAAAEKIKASFARGGVDMSLATARLGVEESADEFAVDCMEGVLEMKALAGVKGPGPVLKKGANAPCSASHSRACVQVLSTDELMPMQTGVVVHVDPATAPVWKLQYLLVGLFDMEECDMSAGPGKPFGCKTDGLLSDTPTIPYTSGYLFGSGKYEETVQTLTPTTAGRRQFDKPVVAALCHEVTEIDFECYAQATFVPHPPKAQVDAGLKRLGKVCSALPWYAGSWGEEELTVWGIVGRTSLRCHAADMVRACDVLSPPEDTAEDLSSLALVRELEAAAPGGEPDTTVLMEEAVSLGAGVAARAARRRAVSAWLKQGMGAGRPPMVFLQTAAAVKAKAAAATRAQARARARGELRSRSGQASSLRPDIEEFPRGDHGEGWRVVETGMDTEGLRLASVLPKWLSDPTWRTPTGALGGVDISVGRLYVRDISLKGLSARVEVRRLPVDVDKIPLAGTPTQQFLSAYRDQVPPGAGVGPAEGREGAVALEFRVVLDKNAGAGAVAQRRAAQYAAQMGDRVSGADGPAAVSSMALGLEVELEFNVTGVLSRFVPLFRAGARTVVRIAVDPSEPTVLGSVRVLATKDSRMHMYDASFGLTPSALSASLDLKVSDEDKAELSVGELDTLMSLTKVLNDGIGDGTSDLLEEVLRSFRLSHVMWASTVGRFGSGVGSAFVPKERRWWSPFAGLNGIASRQLFQRKIKIKSRALEAHNVLSLNYILDAMVLPRGHGLFWAVAGFLATDPTVRAHMAAAAAQPRPPLHESTLDLSLSPSANRLTLAASSDLLIGDAVGLDRARIGVTVSPDGGTARLGAYLPVGSIDGIITRATAYLRSTTNGLSNTNALARAMLIGDGASQDLVDSFDSSVASRRALLSDLKTLGGPMREMFSSATAKSRHFLGARPYSQFGQGMLAAGCTVINEKPSECLGGAGQRGANPFGVPAGDGTFVRGPLPATREFALLQPGLYVMPKKMHAVVSREDGAAMASRLAGARDGAGVAGGAEAGVRAAPEAEAVDMDDIVLDVGEQALADEEESRMLAVARGVDELEAAAVKWALSGEGYDNVRQGVEGASELGLVRTKCNLCLSVITAFQEGRQTSTVCEAVKAGFAARVPPQFDELKAKGRTEAVTKALKLAAMTAEAQCELVRKQVQLRPLRDMAPTGWKLFSTRRTSLHFLIGLARYFDAEGPLAQLLESEAAKHPSWETSDSKAGDFLKALRDEKDLPALVCQTMRRGDGAPSHVLRPSSVEEAEKIMKDAPTFPRPSGTATPENQQAMRLAQLAEAMLPADVRADMLEGSMCSAEEGASMLLSIR